MKRIISALLCVAMLFVFTSCNSDKKIIQKAQEPVDRYMQAFCVLDLKGMAEEVDTQVDYSELPFLNLDELKNRLLIPFSVFDALGVPMDEFNAIVDQLFAAYQNNASYTITDSYIDGNDNVVFTINVDCISLTSMSDVIDVAINKIDLESLKAQIAAATVAGGLKMIFGSGSWTDLIMSAAAPVIENLKLEITRSINELTPQSGTITLVVTQINGEWVISDSMSDVSFLSNAF